VPSIKPQVTLLIDADVLAYNAASGEQIVHDWGDGVTSVVMGTLEDGVQKVLDTAEFYRTTLEADAYVLCLTHPIQFRKRLLESYKGNRSVKPLLVDPIRDALVEKHGAIRRPQLEGDDVMGIYATHPSLVRGKKIIVSIDKDMKTVPGLLFNPGKQTLVEVTREEADYFHLFQTLTGDTTDNYKGCPGIGPVKAEAILHAPNGERYGAWSAWQAIVAAFEAKGLTEDDALLQARMARILRHTDYNFKLKEPILWSPNPSPTSKRTTSAKTATSAGSKSETVARQASSPSKIASIPPRRGTTCAGSST
jgi:DNA polymerase-1